MILTPIAAAGTACVLSCFLTGLIRRYALRAGILDVPNARSSHTTVTPRGGGMAIVAVTLSGISLLGILSIVPAPLACALTGGGALVAAAGWLDDRRGLSSSARAAVHTAAAAWALAWLGGMPKVQAGPFVLHLGLLGWLTALVGIVWMTNLYNFMDGIDGLSASEAVMVGGIGGLFLFWAGSPGAAGAAWMIAGAAAGFLIWNWAPARIFMGDVGSGFLGYAFAVLALFSENRDALPLVGWSLLLGVFIVDATATLIRRIFQGETWYEAHRSHAFQRAVQSGYSHSHVTVAVMALNLLLALLAWAGYRWPMLALPAAGAACVLLLLVWRHFTQHPPRGKT